jgi:hypothetical protein
LNITESVSLRKGDKTVSFGFSKSLNNASIGYGLAAYITADVEKNLFTCCRKKFDGCTAVAKHSKYLEGDQKSGFSGNIFLNGFDVTVVGSATLRRNINQNLFLHDVDQEYANTLSGEIRSMLRNR